MRLPFSFVAADVQGFPALHFEDELGDRTPGIRQRLGMPPFCESTLVTRLTSTFRGNAVGIRFVEQRRAFALP